MQANDAKVIPAPAAASARDEDATMLFGGKRVLEAIYAPARLTSITLCLAPARLGRLIRCELL